MAMISAAMRKLLHQVYGVFKSQIPFDPSYGDQLILVLKLQDGIYVGLRKKPTFSFWDPQSL